MNTFEKKVAVVTGASSGIGRETVLSLINAGYQVHAGARRLDAMRDLESAGAYLHHLDLTRSESIDSFVTEVIKLSGRVDALINNAGYGAYGAVEDIPLSAAREQMEVNLFALAHLIKAVLPTMRKQRSGRIINVSSIGGKLWSPLGGWYHASKFAVEGLSDALRNELRPFGIDVIVIEPGGVKTEWTSIMLDNYEEELRFRTLSGNSGRLGESLFNRSRSCESGGHRRGHLEGGHLKPAEAPLRGPRARAHFPLHPLDIERPSIRPALG